MSAATAFAASHTSSAPRQDTVRALFFLVGASDPGLLPRLIEPVAKLGHVPTRVHASTEAGDGSELTVDLRVSGVSRRTAKLIEHALRSVVGIRQVIAVVEADG